MLARAFQQGVPDRDRRQTLIIEGTGKCTSSLFLSLPPSTNNNNKRYLNSKFESQTKKIEKYKTSTGRRKKHKYIPLNSWSKTSDPGWMVSIPSCMISENGETGKAKPSGPTATTQASKRKFRRFYETFKVAALPPTQQWDGRYSEYSNDLFLGGRDVSWWLPLPFHGPWSTSKQRVPPGEKKR